MKYRSLAIDLGASSGRAVMGVYDGKLSVTEIDRFENKPIFVDGHLRWDICALKEAITRSIKKAGDIDSIGFDTWGVDFGLIDGSGKIIDTPVHYRDERTLGTVEKVLKVIPAAELYHKTGNQIMPINTLFQLVALSEQTPEILKKADKLLFMPDLFAHEFGGKIMCDFSIASTSQMFDPLNKKWSYELIDSLSVPHSILPPVVKSGTIVGTLVGSSAKIVAVGHDTQCAVAALPIFADSAAFISCGTWSLMGTEIDSPILTEASMNAELSNELGANGKVQYLKNIVGLWIIQECARAWQMSFTEIAAAASSAPEPTSFIDPDDPLFAAPCDMPKAIKKFCKNTNQPEPHSVEEIARLVYESLALKYRYTLKQLSKATGKAFTSIHIIGGGANVPLLCQATASACGLPVIAGPSEATAYGNLLVQFSALGAFDLDDGRKLLASTLPLKSFTPNNREKWDEAYNRFVKILKLNM